MAAIDLTGAGGGGISNVTGTSPVVVTVVGTARNVALDQTQFKTINGNSIFGAGNIVISGLTNWTEAYTANLFGSTSSFVALGAAANINAAIIPKGSGAIVADIPDGAATGGNGRGGNAVDLQMIRGAANQVASGSGSVIGGGFNNRNASQESVIGGGNGNFIDTDNIAGGGFIGGGQNNSIGKSNGYNVIVGGFQNTILNFQQDSVIGGGRVNQINTAQSVIAGGTNNTIYTPQTTISGGTLNVGAGQFSSIMGGTENVTQGYYSSVLGGWKGNAYLWGHKAHANGAFSTAGDAQGGETIARLFGSWLTMTTQEIYLDGASQRVTPPTNGVMTVNVDLVAVVTQIIGTATGVAVGDVFGQNSVCLFKNAGGVGTVVQSSDIQKVHSGSMLACDTTYTATGASLKINFTGPSFSGGGTVNIRVVAKVRIVETIY